MLRERIEMDAYDRFLFVPNECHGILFGSPFIDL